MLGDVKQSVGAAGKNRRAGAGIAKREWNMALVQLRWSRGLFFISSPLSNTSTTDFLVSEESTQGSLELFFLVCVATGGAVRKGSRSIFLECELAKLDLENGHED